MKIQVTLPTPLSVNGDRCASITLNHMPTGADLGNHTMIDLLQGERKALGRVVARIGVPTIPAKVIETMDGANLMALQMGVGRFFENVDLDNAVSVVDETAMTTSTVTDTTSSKSQEK